MSLSENRGNISDRFAVSASPNKVEIHAQSTEGKDVTIAMRPDTARDIAEYLKEMADIAILNRRR